MTAPPAEKGEGGRGAGQSGAEAAPAPPATRGGARRSAARRPRPYGRAGRRRRREAAPAGPRPPGGREGPGTGAAAAGDAVAQLKARRGPLLARGAARRRAMAVRGGNALTPFSIQAILNKKEERARHAAGQPPLPGAAGGWRLCGAAEGRPPPSPAAAARAPGPRTPAGWDSDSALSEDPEGERRSEEEGTGGSARPAEAAGGGRPAVEDAQPPEAAERDAAGLSDSEMSAAVSGKDGSGGDPSAPARTGREGPGGERC